MKVMSSSHSALLDQVVLPAVARGERAFSVALARISSTIWSAAPEADGNRPKGSASLTFADPRRRFTLWLLRLRSR